jgi:hypothetical protein
MVKIVNERAIILGFKLLELLWWACCRQVKQTATLDEKIPIDLGFCTVPGLLFV